MNNNNLKADMLQAMRRLAKSVTIISTSNGTSASPWPPPRSIR